LYVCLARGIASTFLMNPFMRRVGVAFALMLAVSASAGLGSRSARAADLTPQQKQEMKSLYERATRAYDVGKYAEAIEEYQKAYEIGGDPPMLYNIAQAYRLNDEPGEAVRFYRRYLQRAPGARNREDVERKIAEQEKIVDDRAKIQSATQPPVPVPTAPPTPATTPTPSPTTPTTAPTLGPPAPPAATAPGAEASTPAPAVAAEPPSKVRPIVGWSLVGAGVVLGVIAGIEGSVAKSKGDDLTTMSMAKTKVQFDPTIQQAGKNANTTMIVCAIGAGAAAAAGVIVLLTGSSAGEAASEGTPPVASRATVTPWLGAGLVGAGADIRF
jgi:hypothetical protein